MLHANLMEVYIINGNSVQFLQGAFGSVPALSLVSIYGVNLVQIDTKSFQSINSSQLLVEIKDCDEVTVKTGAFDNMQVSNSIMAGALTCGTAKKRSIKIHLGGRTSASISKSFA